MWELLTSAAGGGILGLGGAAIKMFLGYKQKQLELKQAILLARENRENMKLELELERLRGNRELAVREIEADTQGLVSAIQAEASITGTSRYVNDIRGLTRPVLTFVLVALAAFRPEPDFIFLATTAVTFWFGDRPRRKRL